MLGIFLTVSLEKSINQEYIQSAKCELFPGRKLLPVHKICARIDL